MITVSLGTIPFSFDRAINWISILLERGIISESVFVQHGTTDVSKLSKYPSVTTAPIVETSLLRKKMADSRLIISHAGQGLTKVLASQGACFVLLPRLARYKEHIDDHQLLFAQEVEKLGILYCLSLSDLEQVILHPPPRFQRKLFEEPRLVDYLSEMYPV